MLSKKHSTMQRGWTRNDLLLLVLIIWFAVYYLVLNRIFKGLGDAYELIYVG